MKLWKGNFYIKDVFYTFVKNTRIMSTTTKKTAKTTGLSGAVKPKKTNSLKEKKQTRFNKIWDEAKGLFKEEFEKGLIKHPV